MLEKLRRLSYELDDLMVKVYRHEAEMVELRRHIEVGSAPSPPLNQQTRNYRFLIPIYSGECSTLSRIFIFFHTWALSHKSEDALNHSRSVPMTTKKSRTELEIKYGRESVKQALVVWSVLTKAVKKDKTIADIVVGAKAPSEAWKVLISMVEDEDSERAREKAKKNFEGLSMMDNAKSMEE